MRRLCAWLTAIAQQALKPWRRLLGFETSHQIDEFLKVHDALEDYTLEDLEREREGLRRLGF